MTLFATVEKNLVFEEKTLIRFYWSKEEAPKNALIVKNLPVRDDESMNYLTTDLLISEDTVSYTAEAWERFQSDLENYEEF